MTIQSLPFRAPRWPTLRAGVPAFVMAVILLTLGLFLIYPVVLILLTSFMVQPEVFVGPRQWGLDNWIKGFEDPRILRALWNTFLVWGLTMVISLPVSIIISWTLARTRIPFSHTIEFLFWVAYMTPGGVIAWILLADPQIGILNVALRQVFTGLTDGPFNIFSLWGIVWVNLMGNGIALKVMLLTPAFRNMDVSLEEAARVGGSSSVRTMLRITLPLMIAPIAMVFALQLVKIFQSFETELLLGTPWGFYVYSTLIYELVRTTEPPLYSQAAVLASLTLLIIALIIPFQRWILSRREYTTLTGSFKPGLLDLGLWKWVVFALLALLHFVLTAVQFASLVLGSFMTRSGYFKIDPIFSLEHWQFVFNESLFLTALRTTLTLATTTAIISPVLFAVLAYILVRTHWPGRRVLDIMIWGSAAVPGMLAGLGLLMLFIGTPGLTFLYGTIWAMLIVVVLQGKVTGVNILKGGLVQIGKDMEEAARVSGAGWTRAFFLIWIPLLMPTLILIGTFSFVIAAGTTAGIILLASRGTITLSILVLQYASPINSHYEAASVVSIIIVSLTLGLALIARKFGTKLSVLPRE
jgi:iron(III) transport system permease protein